MSTTFRIIIIIILYFILEYLVRVEANSVSLSKYWEEYKTVRTKLEMQYEKLSKGNDYNLVRYAAEENIFFIGYSSQYSNLSETTIFAKGSIKDDEGLKNAENITEYQ